MTVKLIQFNGYFLDHFENRIKDGLICEKAVLAVVNKFIRVIFAMLSRENFF
jgi:hypothetical protein